MQGLKASTSHACASYAHSTSWRQSEVWTPVHPTSPSRRLSMGSSRKAFGHIACLRLLLWHFQGGTLSARPITVHPTTQYTSSGWRQGCCKIKFPLEFPDANLDIIRVKTLYRQSYCPCMNHHFLVSLWELCRADGLREDCGINVKMHIKLHPT